MAGLGVLHERRPRDHLDDDVVQQTRETGERPLEVDEQDDSRAVGVVPRLVLEDVVEHEALALRPVPDVVADANAARVAGFGHHEREVVAEHTLVGAPVRRDPLVRSEDREHRGGHARDALEQPIGLRAAFDVPARGEAVAVEEEGLPAVVVGDLVLVGGDVLKIGQSVRVAKHLLELGADRGGTGFELGHPRELDRVEERVVADHRVAAEVTVEPADEALADAVRHVDEALTQRLGSRPPIFGFGVHGPTRVAAAVTCRASGRGSLARRRRR